MINIFNKISELVDKQTKEMTLNDKVKDRYEKLIEEVYEVRGEISYDYDVCGNEKNVVDVNTEKLVYELIDIIVVSLSFIKVLIGLELNHFLFMIGKKLKKWENEQ